MFIIHGGYTILPISTRRQGMVLSPRPRTELQRRCSSELGSLIQHLKDVNLAFFGGLALVANEAFQVSELDLLTLYDPGNERGSAYHSVLLFLYHFKQILKRGNLIITKILKVNLRNVLSFFSQQGWSKY